MSWWNGISRVEQRKWSARGWWLLLHFYAYGVLILKEVIAALATSEFLLLMLVVLANGFAYVTLQMSTPGYVVASELDLEGGAYDHQMPVMEQQQQEMDHHDSSRQQQEQQQQQRLIAKDSNDDGSSPQSNPQHNRLCQVCNVYQPLRTKHCKHCDLCVRQYDHHCDCAGTCIGEKNRRKFFLFLVTQSVEALHGLGLMGSAFYMRHTVEEWLDTNWPALVAWIALVFVVLFTLPLLCYQMYLISTNQTSWEHARRRHITYLNSLPSHDFRSPFDRGCVMNWWIFCTAGDANKWVHSRASSVAAAAAASSELPRLLRPHLDASEDESALL